MSIWNRNLTNLISISFVGGILGSGLQYLVYVVVGRSLGPEALGLFTFGVVVLNVGTLVAKVGLNQAVRKYVPVYRDAGEDGLLSGLLILCLGIPFVLGIAIAAVGYLSSTYIADQTSPAFAHITQLFLFGLPFMAVMTVSRAATTGFLRTSYAVAIKDIGQSGSAILFVLAGTVYVGTVESAAIGYVLSLVIAAGLGVYFLYTLGGFSGLSNTAFETKDILVFSFPLTVAAVSQYLVSWTDVLMLGALSTSAAVGRYQAAFQTAMILGFLLVATDAIFPPFASSLYTEGELEKLRNAYAALTKWVTYLTVLGYIYIVLFSTDILLLFGEEFVDVGTLLALLGATYVFTVAVGPSGYVLMMADLERIETANTVIAALTNIVLNYVLIQRFDIWGAAIATSISLSLLNLLRLGELWGYLGIRPRIGNYWKGGIAIFIATIVMLVGHSVYDQSILAVLLIGLVSLLAFGIVIFFVGFDRDDRLLVENLS